MNDVINIFGIEIRTWTAKAAMKTMIEFMSNDAFRAAEILSLDTLVHEQDNAEWVEHMQSVDVVLAGEKEILEAAGIQDHVLLREASERVFLKLFLKYLQKNHKKVYLVAHGEEELQQLQEEIGQYNRGIQIAGSGILTEEDARVDQLINDINGVEKDCVISVLDSPLQEEFLANNRTLLNTRLWIGCREVLQQQYQEKKARGRFRHFILKRIFHYRVEKERRED